MANIFQKILLKKPKYSKFDLSFDHKLSLKMGYMTPTYCQEVLPGDRYRISSEAMFRLAPMVAPIMHKVDIYSYYYFVPNRIIWPGWESFISPPNADSVRPPLPVFTDRQIAASSLGNYLGLPVVDSAPGINMPVSALPFAAYQKIWHDWFRAQAFDESEFVPLINGNNNAEWDFFGTLRKKAWEHDYFTAALPYAQKGPSVTLPFAGPLDVYAQFPVEGDSNPQWKKEDGTPVDDSAGQHILATPGVNPAESWAGPSLSPAIYDPNGTLKVDMGLDSPTINDLRTAYSLQKWLEKNARAGTRYVESVLANFGVRSSDARLQKAEFIGGWRQNMMISEVLQTSETSEASPLADMAGHGISVGQGKQCQYHAEEHGYLIGFTCVLPKTAYMQGVPRHFRKVDFFDYAFPDFAHLGEQPVRNHEIYFDPAHTVGYDPMGTWGYLPRYAEYRYNPSMVSGAMATSLDFWHMARKFEGLPLLNDSFIQADPTRRIYAAAEVLEDDIVSHIYHKITATRALPRYGNPGWNA